MNRSPHTPLPAGVHTSVAHVADDWYVLCRSSALGRDPLPVMLMGMPLVLFRNGRGEPGALQDRCPHRNAPLSLGRVCGDVLQCRYHGWEFDIGGQCRSVPGLLREPQAKASRAPSHAVTERQGFVWVYATPDTTPARTPFSFPHLNEKGYFTAVQEAEAEASVHATAENALDVPHTAYLHGGLFRSASGVRREIEVHVRRAGDRVEAEYIGESRPRGVAGRLLAPRGGAVTHVDRFILPSIAQVEYRLGDATHLCVTSALTPVENFRTKLFTVVSFRVPLPGWIVAPLLKPLFLQIFRQDAQILKAQTENIRKFGGEQFVSTPIDVLGPEILRLLRQAERGERETGSMVTTKSLRMMV